MALARVLFVHARPLNKKKKFAGKRKGLPSNQEVEHCTENSSDPVRKLGEVVKEMVSDAPTEMVCVSGKSTEDGLNASKMSKDDDEEQVQTHVKTCTFEDGKLAGDIGMDRDIKDNSADDQLIVVENCAGAKTPDKTLEVASTMWKEVEQEVVGDGKSVLSTTSFNDALHKSAAYNLRNDQERDSDLPDDKHLQNNRSDKKNECKKCRTEKINSEKKRKQQKNVKLYMLDLPKW